MQCAQYEPRVEGGFQMQIRRSSLSPRRFGCYPQTKGGQVKGLATTTARRSPLAPDIPTAAESGMTGLEFASWYGFWSPKDVPAEVVSWLNTPINEATADLTKAGRFAKLGQEPVTGTPEDFARYIAADFKRSEALLKAANFKPM